MLRRAAGGTASAYVSLCEACLEVYVDLGLVDGPQRVYVLPSGQGIVRDERGRFGGALA